jgi:ubiquinone biosynthesis protein UbiJ
VPCTRNVKLISEDPGFDPVAITPTDSEERRIHEGEIARKSLDEKICEERKTGVGDGNPTLNELSERIAEVQDQLLRLESKIDTLIEAAKSSSIS